MNKNTNTPIGYNLDNAIKDMNKAVNKEVVIDKEVNHKPVEPKKVGRPTKMDKVMKDKVIDLAERYFFKRSICGKAGIAVDTLNDCLRDNNNFSSSFMHARDLWIAEKQNLLMTYAMDKEGNKGRDWRAIKYLLTIADKEFSERKYLTEAVSNQEAKILMLIKAEKLTIASKQGEKMLESVIDTPLQDETISLKPFKKPKPKNVKNKG